MIRQSTTPSILLHFCLDFLGDIMGQFQILAQNADVERRRFAFIHGAANHAARIEGEFQIAQTRARANAFRNMLHIFLRGMIAMLRQLHLDHGIHRARHWAYRRPTSRA